MRTFWSVVRSQQNHSLGLRFCPQEAAGIWGMHFIIYHLISRTIYQDFIISAAYLICYDLLFLKALSDTSSPIQVDYPASPAISSEDSEYVDTGNYSWMIIRNTPFFRKKRKKRKNRTPTRLWCHIYTQDLMLYSLAWMKWKTRSGSWVGGSCKQRRRKRPWP